MKELEKQVEAVTATDGVATFPSRVLFSRREFPQMFGGKNDRKKMQKLPTIQ